MSRYIVNTQHNAPHFVSLSHFEGPLDLLLHLVKEQEVDIFDVNLYLLTSQYLDHLRAISFQDLAEVGSYVQMASTLLQLKSIGLLPVDVQQEVVEDDVDPIAEKMRLLERLQDHETFKNAAEFFHGVMLLGGCRQISGCGDFWCKQYESTALPQKEDPAVLCILYAQALTSLPERQKTRMVAKSHVLAVESVMARLCDLLEVCGSLRFEDLYGSIPHRAGLVASMVSVLQLAAQNRMELIQEFPYATLWMYQEQEDPVVNRQNARVKDQVIAQDFSENVCVDVRKGLQEFSDVFYVS